MRFDYGGSNTKITEISCRIIFVLVSLTTKQVEPLFGELEYIEAQLKALGM